MAINPTFVASPMTTPQSWTHADAAATSKTIYTAGANGSKVVAINAASSDSSARVFILYLNRSSTAYQIGSATVAITAGTDGTTATQNLLANIPGLPKDNDGQAYLFLQQGDILQAANVTQLTAAKEIDVVVIAGDF